MKKPVVWCIAGVDPTGLSGICVDLETCKQFQVEPCSIITAVTAQNTFGVAAIEYLSADTIRAQYKALQQTFYPNAIKIGMLGAIETHETMLPFLKAYSGFSVLDPILRASTGKALIAGHEARYISSLIRLFPYVDLVTPNRIEAESLLKRQIKTYEAIEEAAHALLTLGAKSVLLKGGHFDEEGLSQDYWTNGQTSFWLANVRLSHSHCRGTGCTFSSAIAACLALGYSIKDALVIAKMYVHRGIRNSVAIVQGSNKLFHDAWPERQMDLPYLSLKPLKHAPVAFNLNSAVDSTSSHISGSRNDSTAEFRFKRCDLGLYPIVDRSHWLETLLPLGVKVIQLRIKDLQGSALEAEIKSSVRLAKQYHATLFINDYWDLAIQFGAGGVHLGQADLLTADVAKIRRSGLYLGISTHGYYEVAMAHTVNPSYIACGPIYATTSKIMPFDPQGIEQLKRWRRTLQYPLVAIGGINLERLPDVLTTKVEGVSLISAITKAADPVRVTQQFLNTIREHSYG